MCCHCCVVYILNVYHIFIKKLKKYLQMLLSSQHFNLIITNQTCRKPQLMYWETATFVINVFLRRISERSPRLCIRRMTARKCQNPTSVTKNINLTVKRFHFVAASAHLCSETMHYLWAKEKQFCYTTHVFGRCMLTTPESEWKTVVKYSTKWPAIAQTRRCHCHHLPNMSHTEIYDL